MSDPFKEERGPTLDEYAEIDKHVSAPNLMHRLDYIDRMAIANNMSCEDIVKNILNNR